jgi:hypothetical protein
MLKEKMALSVLFVKRLEYFSSFLSSSFFLSSILSIENDTFD